MTTSTTLKHGQYLQYVTPWAKREHGIYQFVTETLVKTAVGIANTGKRGEQRESVGIIPDWWGMNARYSMCIDEKHSVADARAHSEKAHRDMPMSNYEYFLCREGVLETYHAEEQHMGLLVLTDDYQIRIALKAPYHKFCNRDAELRLAFVAWRNLELDQQKTADDVRDAQRGRMPVKFHEPIRLYMRNVDPKQYGLQAAEIVAQVPGIVQSFNGSAMKARNAFADDALQGRIAGVGVLDEHASPRLYVVESSDRL